MADLATFAPVPVAVSLGDGAPDVEVLPLKMRQIPAFAAAIEPVAPLLLAGDYLRAIRDAPAAVNAAITIATDVPCERLDELYADAFARLVRTVVEVNADFFIQRVLPEATEAIAVLRRHLIAQTPPPPAPDGEPSSPGSVPEESPSTPASD